MPGMGVILWGESPLYQIWKGVILTTLKVLAESKAWETDPLKEAVAPVTIVLFYVGTSQGHDGSDVVSKRSDVDVLVARESLNAPTASIRTKFEKFPYGPFW